nr:phospholipase-like, aminotransferase-like mobile domain protein [Tanacetum cinerariifolium]
MLQKQKISDNDHYDLPLIYSVNGHTLHFGRRKFCLISGFKFGFLSFRKFREGDIIFRDRVFPEKIVEYLKNIDLLSLIEDEYRFTSLSDPDSIRVCLLLSLEVIFVGHELGSAVDDVFLRMVEDLDVWNDFPWGEHMWRELYGATRNVNLNHQQRHHKALEMNPNFVLTYSLSGFLLSSREKDRDAESGCQTSIKEVSLKDCVKAMEGLCTSLMILSKEIKSLKVRVYKLETIINMVNFGDLGDKYLSDKYDEFFSFNVSPNQSANNDPVNELVDALDDLVDEFLIKSSWRHCKFPWCNDISVDGLFWDALIGLDDKRLGWLLDDAKNQTVTSILTNVRPNQNGLKEALIFFKMYTPRAPLVEHGGLFGAYLKKLSLARTRREKDGDAKSGCQTSTKEVYLKDRVKAIEGLCTSLMILPKEIKSLKSRVYKLVTIINMVNFGDFGDKYWSDKDGEFFSFNVSPHQSANKDHVNELIDALDDLVDESYKFTHNGVVEVEKDLSEDDGLKDQKLEAENKRLAEQRRIRFHKMKEQENDMKSSNFSNSSHMKLALEKCGTNKRKIANVLRPPVEEDTYVKVLSIDTLKNQNNVLDQYMIEKCQQFKPWGEEFLIKSSWRHCKLPWCNDISVDGRFWDALTGLDDKRLGWLLDDVFIPLNEPKRHWSLAQLYMQSGNITFYDSKNIKGVEYRSWLAHGVPLAVKDPIQMALAYREKMVKL